MNNEFADLHDPDMLDWIAFIVEKNEELEENIKPVRVHICNESDYALFYESLPS